MKFPLDLQFKIIALANQVYIRDREGRDVLYVKQKILKLKENIEIYTDPSKSKLAYTLKADRVIDFSPQLTLQDEDGKTLGSVKRHGGKSIWRATYDIELGSNKSYKVREANPWVKMGDAIFGSIPFVGVLSGYIFQPVYRVIDHNEQEVASVQKLPAFLQGKYQLDSQSLESLSESEQEIFVALMMTVVLFERYRG